MIKEDFLRLIEKMHQEEIEEHRNKGADYASESDVLSNFKEEGQDLDLSPEKILEVYLNKHIRAIKKFIKTGKLESEPIESRIKDSRLYLALLQALIEEKSQNKYETIYFNPMSKEEHKKSN